MMSETGVVQAAGWVKVLLIGILCIMALLAPTVAKRARAADFTISGTVTDESSAPIENIRVTVKRVQFGDFGNSTWTDVVSGTTSVTGQYLLNVPDAGPFRIEFADSIMPRRYHTEYFDDTINRDKSKDVLIPDGQSSITADAQLTAIQPLMGHVTDEISNPLVNIRVSALHLVGDPRLGPQRWEPFIDTYTDATGGYSLAASEFIPFRIEFADGSSSPKYLTEYYDNAVSPWQAVDISFDKDHSIVVVDAQLAVASVITGRVTDSVGQPVNQLVVFAGYPVADEVGQVFLQESRETTPDNEGYYTLTLPLSGTVGVGIIDQLFPRRFAQQYYDHVAFASWPTSVTATLGNVTPNIDFHVDFFGVVSGVITDKDGNPLEGIAVSGYQIITDSVGNPSWQNMTDYTMSQSDGSYQLRVPFPVATHICTNLRLNPLQTIEYISQCYGSQSDDPSTGTDITVEANQAVPNINFQLGRLAKVSGRVTGASGEPIQYTTVMAHHVGFNPDGTLGWGGGSWFDETDSEGYYEIKGIQLGNIVLSAAPMEPSSYVAEYYEDQTNPELSHVFTVEANSIVNIDFQLSLKGVITGIVANPTGQPLAGVSATAFYYYWDGTGGKSWIPYAGATTDDQGVYTITQIVPGTYRIGFGVGQDYIPEFYPHTTTVQSATDIILGLGESASNVDGTLASLFRTISGRVTDPSGNPLEGISVQLGTFTFSSWNPSGYSTNTDASGMYTLTGLPNGTFNVGFVDYSNQFVTEYYPNSSGARGVSAMEIPSTSPITEVNAQMGGLSHIRGMVTGPEGEPAPNQLMRIWDGIPQVNYDGGLIWTQLGSTQTITDGSYDFAIPGGTYRICTGDVWAITIYEGLCYLQSVSDDLALATPMTVEHNSELTGVDFHLSKKAQPNGTVTIVLKSTPQSIRNIHFVGPLGEFALDDPALDDGDAYTSTQVFDILTGVYSFTVRTPSDRLLTNLYCDQTGQSTPDIANDSVQVYLLSGGSITCTFEIATAVKIHTLSYHDADGNGMQNGGEAGQPGWQVTMVHLASNTYFETYSNETGNIERTDLPPGQYLVCQTLQPDWQTTQPGFLDESNQRPCYWITLNSGQTANIHFGNIEANDPDFTNTPSTSPDGFVISDAPVVDDTDEENPTSVSVYLPFVSR